MRSWLGWTCLCVALTAACSARRATSSAQPISRRSSWAVQCRYGPAPDDQEPIFVSLGLNVVAAARTVYDALEGLGYRLEGTVPAVYRTVPRTAWPARVDSALRRFSYPGTGVEIVLARQGDSIVALGGVLALCASTPGSPDSVIQIARRLEATPIMAELRRRMGR